MSKHELWKGEAAERYRIMDDMEERRAAREQQALRSSEREESDREEYRRRLDEQRGIRRERPDTSYDYRGRGPRGYQRSDERISDEIHDRLTADRHLDAREIQISIIDAEVTLTGVVDSRAARRRAEDIAENVSGVRYVLNNIRVRQPGTSGATG